MTDSATDIGNLPALAVITRYVGLRPYWAAKEPFPVPAELYAEGATEIEAAMRKRGLGRPVDCGLKAKGIEHFMLWGTPIVAKAE